jgi:Acetyltransferases, including N-acetylases of ribosomal proteins
MIYLNSSNLKDAKFLLYTHNIHTKNGYNISTNVVKFKDHIKWYRKKLKSKNSKIYIGYKNKAKFGYVRFDRIKNKLFKVSIGNHPKFYGKKLGTKMLNLAIKKFVKSYKPKRIISCVKKFNIRSQKCFLNNGFRNIKKFSKKELDIDNKINSKNLKIYEYKVK